MFDRNSWIGIAGTVVVMASAGCATHDPSSVGVDAAAELSTLRGEIETRNDQISRLSRELEQARLPDVASAPATTRAAAAGGTDLLPPEAKAGQCYARVMVPPQYETSEERVLVKAAAEKLEVVPASYDTAEERVLIKEASEKLEVVPATYEWVEERVMVKPASTRLERVPAKYEQAEEQVLVRPAETVWKKGRGPIERVDNATGEIMCLVEEPAVYKTVRKRVETSPETTREIAIPAEYETVRKRVVKKPATTRKVEIPAEYRSVQVRKIARPASTRKTEIPAEYETVPKRKLVAGGQNAWREILCETNVSPGIVRDIQSALLKLGHEPGPIDGRLGSKTMRAVADFQRAKGLPTGQLTLATVDALGVGARR